MRSARRVSVLAVTLAVLALSLGACDGDDASTTATTSTTATAGTGGDTTTSTAADLAQPAVWPAPDVVFDTPESAAEDFVREALGVPPTLGEFEQGDSRSGEIKVFTPNEETGEPVLARAVLLLRQLGPSDGWFVIGAISDQATIAEPETLAEVPAGPLTVEGVGRGFEATVVVSAFLAGDADALLDEEVTQGGPFETPEPYRVTLDLSAASPGDVVVLLVRGDTGLETDPGDFSAIPVVVTA